MSSPKLSERLRAIRDLAQPLTRQGEDYIWRPCKKIVDQVDALLLAISLEAQVQGSSGQEGEDLPSGEPVAWMAEDGIPIAAFDYLNAKGLNLPAVDYWKRYTIPLYRRAPEVDVEAVIREVQAWLAREYDGSLNASWNHLRTRLSRLLSGPSGSGEEKPVK